MATLNSATAIYLGSTAVSAVYVGATKVWPEDVVSLPIEIDASGWTATALDDPDTAILLPITVQRAGYSTAGLPTRNAEAIRVSARLRKPYPDHATLTDDTLVLSEWIYDGDDIPGAVNGSLQKSPKPQFAWLHHDHEIIEGDSLTLRCFVAHAHPRNSQPVAAVKYIVSDGTNTVETVTSTVAPITYAASGLTVPAFEGTLDISDLDDGELLVDAIIYPWVGDAFQLSTDGLPLGDMRLCPMTMWRQGSLPRTYAYVATDGNDSTGAASTDPATAKAAPFASHLAASNAIVSAAGDASWGVIRFRAGTYVRGAVKPSTPTAPMTWEAEAGEAVTISDGGASVSGTTSVPTRLIVRGVTFQRQPGTVRMLDGNNSKVVADRNVLALVDCDFDINGQTPQTYWFSKCLRIWVIGCADINGPALPLHNNGTDAKTSVVIGSSLRAGNSSLVILGSKCGYWTVNEPNENRPLHGPGVVCGFSVFSGDGTNYLVSPGAKVDDVDDLGIAVVGCVIERTAGTNVGLYINADNDHNRTTNVNVQMTTSTMLANGGRFNRLYNDTGNDPVEKWGTMRFCVFPIWACKTDVFAQDGNLTGNWAAVMHVGSCYSTMRQGSPGSSNIGAGSWRREVVFPGLQFGDGEGGDLDPVWADADFRPDPDAGLQTYPGHLVPYPCDMLGQPIPTDGTAIVGALQAAP